MDLHASWGLAWLSADGKKLLATRVLRTFGYGYLAVVLGIYLQQLGLDPRQVGILLTGAIAGSAVMTLAWSLVADRYGRRRTVAAMALLAAGGLLFALTDNFWLLLLGAFTGTISATSSEVGPFTTVEQTVLPQTAPSERRTWLFSSYECSATLPAPPEHSALEAWPSSPAWGSRAPTPTDHCSFSTRR
jgi:MFS family permease